MRTSTLLAIFISLVASAANGFGQDHYDFQVGEVNYRVTSNYQLEITPSAFRTRDTPITFIKDDLELLEGNAAIYYYRACLCWYAQSQEVRNQLSKNWESWYLSKLDEMPAKEVAEFLSRFDELMKQFEIATNRRECEWDFGFSQMEYSEFISHHLMEINTLRTIGYLNRLRTRLEISNGDFESAHESIRRGFKLAFDLGEPILVVGLVGESLAAMSLQSVSELSQTAGSPNYQHALQALPFPLINFRGLMLFESQLIERGFELMQAPEKSTRSPDQWKQVYLDAIEQMDLIFLQNDRKPENGKDRESRTAILLAQLYPIAKRELIRDGWEKEKVDAMPVGQVVAIQTRKVWDESKALMLDFAHLSTPEASELAKKRLEEFGAQGFDQPRARGDFPLAIFAPQTIGNLVPSGSRLRNRQVAIMKNVEQIRNFAAKQNELPTSDQFKALNPTRDPGTGKVLDYERKSATTAILQTTERFSEKYPKNRYIDIRFVIELKK